MQPAELQWKSGSGSKAEDLRTGLVTHIASAYLTFVALDDNKRPTPVPPYNPETPEALRRKSRPK